MLPNRPNGCLLAARRFARSGERWQDRRKKDRQETNEPSKARARHARGTMFEPEIGHCIAEAMLVQSGGGPCTKQRATRRVVAG
jgi:hypothetical protein